LTVPGIEYEIISDTEEPLRHYWVIFEGGDVVNLVNEVFGRITPFAVPFAGCDRAIEVISDVLCGNFGVVNEHYYHIGSFYRLLALHSPLPKPPANIHHHDFSMYLKAMDYIENEYNQRITVNEIASRIHIVPSYLYRIFIKYSGMSPQQALIKKRMEMAAILLDQQKYTVGQIAEMTGYGDSLQFSKFFKKYFSMSPKQYQNRNQ
ncbi:MAG: helix-turn-helix transcriptional regulator, partial [Clostridia bacterium]|nr:helix-turn-helix transcriptional regulator [Clostridia bacterium]